MVSPCNSFNILDLHDFSNGTETLNSEFPAEPAHPAAKSFVSIASAERSFFFERQIETLVVELSCTDVVRQKENASTEAKSGLTRT